MANPDRRAKLDKRILVVDDEVAIRLAIETLLRKRGYRYSSAQSGKEALQLLQSNEYDVVITDLHMERRDTGLEVVRAAVGRRPQTSVLVITGYGNVENAVAAMKAGAFDFIEKPFSSIDELEATIEAALARSRSSLPRAEPAGTEERDPFEGIIGEDDKLLDIFDVVRRLSDTAATVLLTGESGTGKELFARALHRTSVRRKGPFIPINCCAIPDALLEAELFGARRGAYTGATGDRVGLFQAAHGGTIFLDEIGDMPSYLQVKLLRVLQSREVTPLGANEPIKVDVRVLAATHRDLEAAVADGSFREDLYYRLNVIPIDIPPLRERRGDILSIADHFVDRFNAEIGRNVTGFSAAAKDVLVGYAWPGNIRELENTLERMVILTGEGEIDVRDLPAKLHRRYDIDKQPPVHTEEVPVLQRPNAILGRETVEVEPVKRFDRHAKSLDELRIVLPEAGVDLRELIGQIEYDLIDQALQRTDGNKAKAARLLGMNRTTLVERLKKRK